MNNSGHPNPGTPPETKAESSVPAPGGKVNRIGLGRADYKGKPSTLCSGCGHDSISNQLVTACYDLGIDPYTVGKFSGIGCSSKTPAYFLNLASGFNAVHGRMPAIATGAVLANRTIRPVGVSGDGDTASIGLGQFMHMLRRNIPVLYIIENNGVYGLTKGQFSATAEEGARSKSGQANDLPAMDCCALAVLLGCGFVARTFSGDVKQLSAILKAGLSHRGTALVDVISPCVTFNNHPESHKSWDWSKEHEIPLHEIGFVPYFEEIQVDIQEGATQDVRLHDGSTITLRKLHGDHDPTDRAAAVGLLEDSRAKNEFLTGIIYVDPKRDDYVSLANMVDEPLATLPQERVRPSRESLKQVIDELR